MDLTFRVGKSGAVNVIASIEPVTIDDKKVSKIRIGSLNSWKQKDVLVGDKIQLTLSGHGTPFMEQVIWRREPRLHPNTSSLENFHSLSCLAYTPDCAPQFVARLAWLGKQLKIRGVGEKTWKIWVEQYGLSTLLGWLSPHWQDSLPKNKKTTNALSQLQKTSMQPIKNWLKGIGIPLEIKHLSMISTIEELSEQETVEALGLSEKRKQALKYWLAEPEIQKVLYTLQELYTLQKLDISH